MSRNSSAELAVLLDIAELSKRCGLRPSDTDALIDFDMDREDGGDYLLSFVWGPESDDPNLQKFRELLDIKSTDHVFADSMRDFEDRVEKALSLAPRARTR
jgi:hypothetical protein